MTQLTISLSGDGRAVMRSLTEIFESTTLTSGEPKEIPGGATVTLQPMQERRALTFDAGHAMELVMTAASGVGLNLASSYIYDKLKGGKGKVELSVNRRITEIDEGQVTRVIEEEMKFTKNA